jgi:hypothetical protein
VPFRENYTVNFLTRQTYAMLHAANGPIDHAAYRAARLTLAKTLLDQFVMVGITEHMEESIENLRFIAGSTASSCHFRLSESRNVSRDLRDDVS